MGGGGRLVRQIGGSIKVLSRNLPNCLLGLLAVKSGLLERARWGGLMQLVRRLVDREQGHGVHSCARAASLSVRR